MKIRLSEDEVYEIKMPEEIGIEEFQGITAKFNFLSKNFTKFNIGDNSQSNQGEIVLKGDVVKKYKNRNQERWNLLRDNRDILVEFLKTHYFKTKDEFYETISKYNADFTKADMCSPKIVALREMHRIHPNEIGLIKFPTRHEQVVNLKLNKTGEEENE